MQYLRFVHVIVSLKEVQWTENVFRVHTCDFFFLHTKAVILAAEPAVFSQSTAVISACRAETAAATYMKGGAHYRRGERAPPCAVLLHCLHKVCTICISSVLCSIICCRSVTLTAWQRLSSFTLISMSFEKHFISTNPVEFPFEKRQSLREMLHSTDVLVFWRKMNVWLK